MNKAFQILLVEDNPGDIKIIREAFKQCDSTINLSFAHDGVEAIDFLKQENTTIPDLILLDLNLPKKDGKDVLLEVKTDKDLKQIPIIVLTTSESETDINECYKLGANSFITKPMDLESTFSIVKLIETYWIKTTKLPKITEISF